MASDMLFAGVDTVSNLNHFKMTSHRDVGCAPANRSTISQMTKSDFIDNLVYCTHVLGLLQFW